jgi:membrane protein involved in D-alanine export
MIPFSVFEFYVLIFLAVFLIRIVSKYFSVSKFKYILFAFNFTFLVFIFQFPIHFILLILYSYFLLYILLHVINFKVKLFGVILLLIPMILVKLDIRFHFYPFELNQIISFAGLSYASFKVAGLYLQSANKSKMPSFISFFNFLSFTPTLLIGPIDKYSNYLQTESNAYKNLNAEELNTGIILFFKGVVFEYIVAEITFRYWLSLFDFDSKELLAMLNTMYSYYVYLFFDFAGYSFMAVGIAKMIGITVPDNFGNPFLSKNPQEFWKSFHITLGTWLKENFFNPILLFLTRKKRLKKYPLFKQNFAYFATFFLMGCWNGFRVNFILSGALFGIYSLVYNSYTYYKIKHKKEFIFIAVPDRVQSILSIFTMINLVAFALYIFSGYFPYL